MPLLTFFKRKGDMLSPSYVCLFIYLNIYGLFNSVAGTLDCSVSDSRMIGCKECGMCKETVVA